MSTAKTPAQAQASRVNGAKSQGPVTPQGKARSSENALKFGIYSSRIVLPTESQEIYDSLLQRYLDLFQPQDIFEHQTVTAIVNTRWFIRRIESIQSVQFQVHINRLRPLYKNASHEVLTTLAFNQLAESKEGPAATRELERLHRLLDRSYRQLLKHRHGSAPRSAAAPDATTVEAGIPSNFATTSQNTENEPKPPAANPIPHTPATFQPPIPPPPTPASFLATVTRAFRNAS